MQRGCKFCVFQFSMIPIVIVKPIYGNGHHILCIGYPPNPEFTFATIVKAQKMPHPLTTKINAQLTKSGRGEMAVDKNTTWIQGFMLESHVKKRLLHNCQGIKYHDIIDIRNACHFYTDAENKSRSVTRKAMIDMTDTLMEGCTPIPVTAVEAKEYMNDAAIGLRGADIEGILFLGEDDHITLAEIDGTVRELTIADQRRFFDVSNTRKRVCRAPIAEPMMIDNSDESEAGSSEDGSEATESDSLE